MPSTVAVCVALGLAGSVGEFVGVGEVVSLFGIGVGVDDKIALLFVGVGKGLFGFWVSNCSFLLKTSNL
jgi:hypothetical protein